MNSIWSKELNRYITNMEVTRRLVDLAKDGNFNDPRVSNEFTVFADMLRSFSNKSL